MERLQSASNRNGIKLMKNFLIIAPKRVKGILSRVKQEPMRQSKGVKLILISSVLFRQQTGWSYNWILSVHVAREILLFLEWRIAVELFINYAFERIQKLFMMLLALNFHITVTWWKYCIINKPKACLENGPKNIFSTSGNIFWHEKVCLNLQ